MREISAEQIVIDLLEEWLTKSYGKADVARPHGERLDCGR